jgi:hypothetical protein
MRHSEKTIRSRAARRRGRRPIKISPSVDFELLCYWLGQSLLQEKLNGSQPPRPRRTRT